MAKQTKLRELIDFLASAASLGHTQQRHIAEQHIFSLVGDLERTLQYTRSLAAERLHEIKRMHDKHTEEIKALERDEPIEPQPRPFDLEAAKRGEPIEWQPLLAEHWESGEFVGITSTGNVVVELTPLNVNIHPIEKLRMKASAPEQITMYANVRRVSSGAVFGALYDTERVAKLNAEDYANGTHLAVAAPVKITVNK